MAFDPDAYLAKAVAPAPVVQQGGFNPDAYLAKTSVAQYSDERDGDREQAPAEQGGQPVAPSKQGGSGNANDPFLPDGAADRSDVPLLHLKPFDPDSIKDLSPEAQKMIMEDPTTGIHDALAEALNKFSTPKNIGITTAAVATDGLSEVGGAIGGLAKAAISTAGAYFALSGIDPAKKALNNALKVSDDPNSTGADITKAWVEAGVPASQIAGGFAMMGARGLPKASEAVPAPEPINVTPEAPKALPEPQNALPAPSEAPAPTPQPLPEPPAPSTPSLVTSIESVQGLSDKAGPSEVNAAVNEALIKPPQSQTPVPEAPAPSLPEPAAPAQPEPTPVQAPKDSAPANVDYGYEANKIDTGAPGYGSVPPEGEPLTIAEIGDFSGKKFFDYAKELNNRGSGITDEAHRYGEDARGDKEALTELQNQAEDAHADYVLAMAKAKKLTGDAQMDAFQDLSALATKSQFFNEAIQAAKNTGSYASIPKPESNAPAIPATVPVREAPPATQAPDQNNGATGQVPAIGNGLQPTPSAGAPEGLGSSGGVAQNATLANAAGGQAEASLTPQSNAIQIQGPAGLPVPAQTGNSQGVRGQNQGLASVAESQQAPASDSQAPSAGKASPTTKGVGISRGVLNKALAGREVLLAAQDHPLAEVEGPRDYRDEGYASAKHLPDVKVPSLADVTDAPEAPAPIQQGVRVSTEPGAVQAYKEETVADIKKAVSKALSSSAVDILAKRRITSILRDTVGGDLSKVDDLPANALQSILDNIKLEDEVGRKVRADAVAQREAIKSNLIEQMGEEAGISRPINKRTQIATPGERLTAAQTIDKAMKNRVSAALDKATQTGVFLNTRDMQLDTLDGYQQYKGFLSRYLGGDIDRDYNTELSMADQFRKPLSDLMKKSKLDNASMERISMYAIAKQGLADRVLESGGKPSTIFDKLDKDQQGPSQLAKLTPDEQKFYDTARATLDHIGQQVSKLMHSEYNVDLQMVPDYWPLQRDYNQYQAQPEAPSLKVEPGQESAQDVLTKFKDLFDDFLPVKTTKTKQGFTIERLPGAKGPVKLNAAEGLEQHIRAAAHLIANQKSLRLWGEIARSPEFAAQYGTVGQKYVTDLLDTVARNGNPLGTGGSKVLDAMMRNVSAGVLGLRFLSQGKHITNIFSSIKEVPINHLMDGMVDQWSDGPHEWLQKNRPEILNRYGGEQSIQELVGSKSPLSKNGALKSYQAFFFRPERFIDAAVARGSWIGSYRNALEKLGYNPDEWMSIPPNQTAMRQADIATRKVVTSPLLKDVSQALSRNALTMNNATARKALFQFQSTMLRQYSQVTHELKSAAVNKNPAAALATIAVLMAWVGGEQYINHLNKQFKHAVFGGPAPGPEKIGQDLANDMIRRFVPGVGPLISSLRDQDLGIPVVDTLHDTFVAGRHLASGTNEYGKPLSKLQASQYKVDLATGAASLSGLVPGATTIGEGVKQNLPHKHH